MWKNVNVCVRWMHLCARIAYNWLLLADVLCCCTRCNDNDDDVLTTISAKNTHQMQHKISEKKETAKKMSDGCCCYRVQPHLRCKRQSRRRVYAVHEHGWHPQICIKHQRWQLQRAQFEWFLLRLALLESTVSPHASGKRSIDGTVRICLWLFSFFCWREFVYNNFLYCFSRASQPTIAQQFAQIRCGSVAHVNLASANERAFAVLNGFDH